MLGTDISEEEMLGYFEKIGLEYDAEAKEVITPTFRHDLFRLADLAEEVARFTDMTIFRQHFQGERQQQENCHSNFVWRK